MQIITINRVYKGLIQQTPDLELNTYNAQQYAAIMSAKPTEQIEDECAIRKGWNKTMPNTVGMPIRTITYDEPHRFHEHPDDFIDWATITIE